MAQQLQNQWTDDTELPPFDILEWKRVCFPFFNLPPEIRTLIYEYLTDNLDRTQPLHLSRLEDLKKYYNPSFRQMKLRLRSNRDAQDTYTQVFDKTAFGTYKKVTALNFQFYKEFGSYFISHIIVHFQYRHLELLSQTFLTPSYLRGRLAPYAKKVRALVFASDAMQPVLSDIVSAIKAVLERRSDLDLRFGGVERQCVWRERPSMIICVPMLTEYLNNVLQMPLKSLLQDLKSGLIAHIAFRPPKSLYDELHDPSGRSGTRPKWVLNVHKKFRALSAQERCRVTKHCRLLALQAFDVECYFRGGWWESTPSTHKGRSTDVEVHVEGKAGRCMKRYTWSDKSQTLMRTHRYNPSRRKKC
jgi:hypothetical protein